MIYAAPFHYLGQIGYASMGDGAGPDDIDISTEVQSETDRVGCLVADLLHHCAETTPQDLIDAARQFLASVGVAEGAPVPNVSKDCEVLGRGA